VGKNNAAILEAALKLASEGTPVFACNPVNKSPLTEHGFKDATRDEAKIREWWRKTPNAIIGVPTGAATNRVVIDIDSPYADEELRFLAEQNGGEIPRTRAVQSSPGKRHLYFNYPAGKRIGCSDRKLPGQINVRADGGYTIVPPSPHPIGGAYAVVDHSPQADLPAWLLGLLTGAREGEALALKDVPPRWAWVHYNKVLAELRRAPAGDRNNTLNYTAWWAARLSDHPLLKDKRVRDEVIDAAVGVGLDEREARATATSGWGSGLRAKLRILPIHECTDLGNADRFILRNGDKVRYVPAYGSHGWLVWDGRRWNPDSKRAVRKLAHETVRAIYQEAAAVEDNDLRKSLVTWAVRSETDSAIDAMLKEAAPYVAVAPDELDADPELLNLENGTLDLRTGEVRGQRQADLITRMLPVRHDPRAACPAFQKHIEMVLPDEKVRDYFLELQAYHLTGSTGEQCIHILLGDGENGKSTTSDLFRNMAGDYGAVVKREFFADGYQGVAPHDVADLLGKRIVTCSEFEEGDVLRIAVMKGLTSGESSAVKGCRKYGHPFEFRPRAKFILDSNHPLGVDSSDHGTWRRLRVIPFTQRIAAEVKDRRFADKLWAERSGVLNLVIAALRRWNARDRVLEVPDEIQKASEKYKETSDLLRRFIEERCEKNKEHKVSLDSFTAAFQDYAQKAGVKKRKIMGRRALLDRLESIGQELEYDEETHAYRIPGLGLRVQGDAMLYY
jgi:putative DNA primase/helicase